MSFLQPSGRERARGAIAAIALQALLGYALIAGLAVRFSTTPDAGLDTFTVLPDPPPPPREKIVPRRIVSRRAEGAAAPPNLRSRATEIVAPPPIVPPPLPPPIVAAEKPGVGNQATSGNADLPGPGPGSGGVGNGTGSGRYGNGDGDGGREIPPRQTRGIKRGDYPTDLADAGIGGTVGVRYVVTPTGRAVECEVTRSSGNRALDVRTCALIELRYRFKPALDEAGRPVGSVLYHDYRWENDVDD